ncbi:uncharacterized protein LOC134280106 [Saccostrea cucullata]|uniref:uncharacterized protein LOC134280106 n=1 Tax=Saccostrea cuccullata TaxID=36930 RepID=UPI002ED679C3
MPKAKFKSVISTRRSAKRARVAAPQPTVQPEQVPTSALASTVQTPPAASASVTSQVVELPQLSLSATSQTALPNNAVTQPQAVMVPEMNASTSGAGTSSSQGTVESGIGMQTVLSSSVQPSMTNSTQFSLGYHVDNSTKQKIANGEYVNFANLLVRDPSKFQLSALTMNAQGHIIAQPKNANKITSIEKWTDAFLIFSSIFLAAHPSKTQQLLKYLHDVRLGAEKSQGWVTYDEQFRLRMALNPNGNWGVIDNELWLVYMSLSVAVNSQRTSTYYKCFDYNYKGKCTRLQCTYAHRCTKCSEMHPALLCVNAQATPAPNVPNINRTFRSNTSAGQQPQFQTPYQFYARRQTGPQARHLGPGRFPNKN